jgi:hypothetical protein
LAQVCAAALRHRPALAGGTVEGDVQRAVLGRVGVAGGMAAACPGVVGREDAADEGDQRESVVAVVA